MIKTSFRVLKIHWLLCRKCFMVNKNESREIKAGSVEEVQMLGREFGKSE